MNGLLVILSVLFFISGCSYADEIPKSLAVSCIIGEAENQSLDGMKAVALALQNRGTTEGVYGCTSDRVKNRLYSSKIFVQAVRAYEETRNLGCTWADDTQCANSWYSIEDVNKDPVIFDRCVFTGKLKDHYFFKCK